MQQIPYGRQHISESDIQAVVAVLQSDFLTQGPKILEFEKAFAEYIGSRYAVAVSNGTAALHLCALALGVIKGTNVITTPITFAASANCVRYCEGNVYFADINPETFCLDLKAVEDLIKSKPEGFFHGIIPVDLAGYPVDMEAIHQIAERHKLWVIEDACHAPGGYSIDSKHIKQNCGNCQYSDLAIFSFHPVKHIACGEGGMITTNDKDLYQKLLLLRTHGITKDPALLHENHGPWYYEMQELGYNYRLTDFQAALGLSQLSRAKIGIAARRQIAATYFQAFRKITQIKAQSGIHEGHAYHLYIILTDHRKDLYDYLRSRGIFCQVHYIPVNKMPYYSSLPQSGAIFPNADQYYSECLSLPMYPTLTGDEQQFVIEQVNNFFSDVN